MAVYMRNQRCVNGKLEGGNYSAPVPIIGLYTGAASLACLLMMLFDIITGLRARKRWIPCRSFSLNSFTLSLLSISAKIPVDLTTAMPSAIDQLSKLSGTTLVVIAMGFTFPSMLTRNAENWGSNFAALALFVVTVVVNICIQISTGVIVLFIPEHIIILFSMVSVLIAIWVSLLLGSADLDCNYSFMMSGDPYIRDIKSMLQRIKICYVNAHRSNIQFVKYFTDFCDILNAGITGVCLICAVSLLQAAIRSVIFKQLEFCAGTSDYDWSMKFIVFTQILSVLLGDFTTTFRWLSMYPLVIPFFEIYELISNPVEFLANVFVEEIGLFLLLLPIIFLGGCLFCVVWPLMAIMMHGLGCLVMLCCFFYGLVSADMQMDEFGTSNYGDYDDKWILSKNVAKMNTVIEECKMAPQIHLLELLTRIPQSKQLEVRVVENQLTYPLLGKEDVSYIHIKFLVDFIKISIPEHLSATLLKAYEEVASILQELEWLVIRGDPDFLNLSRYLELGDASLYSSDLDRAIAIFSTSPSGASEVFIARKEDRLAVRTIQEIIRSTTLSSFEDLYKFMEQLFVDMLHALLARLPISIDELLSEKFLENYESKIKKVLEILCRARHLENHIQWLVPKGRNITIFPEPPVSETQSTVDVSIPTEDAITVQIG